MSEFVELLNKYLSEHNELLIEKYHTSLCESAQIQSNITNLLRYI